MSSTTKGKEDTNVFQGRPIDDQNKSTGFISIVVTQDIRQTRRSSSQAWTRGVRFVRCSADDGRLNFIQVHNIILSEEVLRGPLHLVIGRTGLTISSTTDDD